MYGHNRCHFENGNVGLPYTLKDFWTDVKNCFRPKPTTQEIIRWHNEAKQEARAKVMELADTWPSIKDDPVKSQQRIRDHIPHFRVAVNLPTDNIRIVEQIRTLLEHPEEIEFIPLEEIEASGAGAGAGAEANTGYNPLPLTGTD